MISFKKYLNEVAKPTGALKKACWKGYTAVGTKEKNGRTVPNCVPEETELDEVSKDNPRHPMHQSDPSLYKKTPKSMTKQYATHAGKYFSNTDKTDFTLDYKKTDKEAPRYKNEEVELEELFDILEEVVYDMAEQNGVDPESIWEELEDVSDEELYESAAWRRKEGKNPTGGLNAKGIASYRRENPGSKLKRAVTGKVKAGSKAAKRRKSFCARMGGMKGPMKKPNGEPTRKALALRKWKCR